MQDILPFISPHICCRVCRLYIDQIIRITRLSRSEFTPGDSTGPAYVFALRIETCSCGFKTRVTLYTERPLQHPSSCFHSFRWNRVLYFATTDRRHVYIFLWKKERDGARAPIITGEGKTQWIQNVQRNGQSRGPLDSWMNGHKSPGQWQLYTSGYIPGVSYTRKSSGWRGERKEGAEKRRTPRAIFPPKTQRILISPSLQLRNSFFWKKSYIDLTPSIMAHSIKPP